MIPSSSDRPHPASFRDPAGRVFLRDSQLLRQVDEVYREDYEALTRSGLLQTLVERGMLIRHEEVDASPLAGTTAYQLLRPELVPFISYPYEWCFSQLKDAALLTLAIQKLALSHGMTLKDSSAYNIQFMDGRPVLIDTLSLERYRAGEPWVAYRQFCEHFLAPLALVSRVDARLSQLLRVHIDGIPVDLASKLLPKATWVQPGMLMHVHIHARAQRSAAATRHLDQRDRSFSLTSLLALVEHLQATVEGLRWDAAQSVWSEYSTTARHYTVEARAAKRAAVDRFLDAASPRTVWDLGANTGEYSRVVSDRGIRVLALDSDPGAVDINYRTCRSRGDTRLLPLVIDLTNPSPALGWSSRERDSLLARGPADAVLVLGLLHHLAISNNLPFVSIAAFLAEIAEWVLVEYVPKDDPKARALLAHRRDVYGDYTEAGFRASFEGYFTCERIAQLPGSSRVIYCGRRRRKT